MRVGVDVGGTTVKIGFVDNKEIIKSYEIKTNKNTLFDDILSSLKEESEKNNYQIDFIGFGIPGVVKDNYIYKLVNINLENYDLKKKVNEYFDVEIKASNDANVAALGEDIFDLDNPESSYMITLGTGVGGGYIYKHQVINGAHSSTGEIGHMFIDKVHNFKCNCGLCGCLETVASATGIVRLAKTYYNDYKTSLNYETMTSKDIFDMAKINDELGLFVYNLVCDYLGQAISIITSVTDVDIIYIGGGVSKAGEFLLDGIKSSYKKYAFHSMKNTEIKLAKLSNNAGIFGASYLK